MRIVGIDVPGFGVPTHAEAKDVLAGAMLNYARDEVEAGPVQRPRAGKSDRPTVDPAGRDVPGRSDDDRRDAGADGSGRRPGRALPRMARALRRARLRRRRGDPSLLHRRRSASSRPQAARSSARRPVGHDGTAAWLARDRRCLRHRRRARSRPRRMRSCPRSSGALAARRSRARITLSGYEGTELLVARLLIESGADVPYVGTACPKTPWSAADAEWLRPRASRSSTAPRWRTTAPRWRRSSPIWPSAPRRWCRRPRNWASRRFTSPT